MTMGEVNTLILGYVPTFAWTPPSYSSVTEACPTTCDSRRRLDEVPEHHAAGAGRALQIAGGMLPGMGGPASTPSNIWERPFAAPGYADFADVDGDGFVDALVCEEKQTDPAVSAWVVSEASVCVIFLNDGTGVFTSAESKAYAEGFLALGVELGSDGADDKVFESLKKSLNFADVDMDGDLDLVTGDCIYINGGGRSGFSLGSNFTVLKSAENQYSAVGDMDGDGDPDLVVGWTVEENSFKQHCKLPCRAYDSLNAMLACR